MADYNEVANRAMVLERAIRAMMDSHTNLRRSRNEKLDEHNTVPCDCLDCENFRDVLETLPGLVTELFVELDTYRDLFQAIDLARHDDEVRFGKGTRPWEMWEEARRYADREYDLLGRPYTLAAKYIALRRDMERLVAQEVKPNAR